MIDGCTTLTIGGIKRTYTVTVELSEDDYRADGGLTINCIDKLAAVARAARG